MIHSPVEDTNAVSSAFAGSSQLEAFVGRTVAFLVEDKLGLEGSSAFQTVAAVEIQTSTVVVEGTQALVVVQDNQPLAVAVEEIQASASAVADKKAFRIVVVGGSRAFADSDQTPSEGSAGR